jgi:hypothetical protein
MEFIKSVPDGVEVRFAAAGCYGQDETLEINDRTNLVIDGNGSTMKALTPGQREHPGRQNVRVNGGANVTIKNLTVRGVKTTGFDGPNPPSPQADNHSGFMVGGTQGFKLLNSKSYDTESDPIGIVHDLRFGICDAPPTRDVFVDAFYGFNSGRTIAITNADGVTIQNSYFGDISAGAIDLEPDLPCAWIRNIKILNNRFGRYHHAFLNMYTNIVAPERSGNLEIRGNVTEAEPFACIPPINFIETSFQPPGVMVKNVIIVDNDLRSLGQGILARSIAEARIENNTLRKNFGNGCTGEEFFDSFGVWLDKAANVNVHGNKLVDGPKGGFSAELFAGSELTGLTRDRRRN